MRFDDASAVLSNVTSNALGLVFDQPLTVHQSPTRASPPFTPQLFISHPPCPATSVSQGNGHQQGGHAFPGRLEQQYVRCASISAGKNQRRRYSCRVPPGTFPFSFLSFDATMAALSVLEDKERKKAEGEAVSLSILTGADLVEHVRKLFYPRRPRRVTTRKGLPSNSPTVISMFSTSFKLYRSVASKRTTA